MGFECDELHLICDRLARRGEGDLVAAPIGGVLGPRHETLARHLVDAHYEMALVEVQRAGQLLLRERPEVVQRPEDGHVSQQKTLLT